LRVEPADLVEVAEEAVASMEPLVTEVALALVVEVPRPLELLIDAQRVGQVVLNLVSNAAKFTPKGGSITVTVTASPAEARVEVTDTGPGIAAADLPKLFQRFSQLEGARGGTGLGLSICKALVEAHGGAIGVRSQLGAGSTFWFTLPR